MDVLANPFNQHLGLVLADEPGFIYALPESSTYTNHLGTIHAAAQFALAEATSGAILIRELAARFPAPFAVVRHVEGKFRNPLQGPVRSRGEILTKDLESAISQLESRGRALITVQVEIVDRTGSVGLQAKIEWFVRLDSPARAEGAG